MREDLPSKVELCRHLMHAHLAIAGLWGFIAIIHDEGWYITVSVGMVLVDLVGAHYWWRANRRAGW